MRDLAAPFVEEYQVALLQLSFPDLLAGIVLQLCRAWDIGAVDSRIEFGGKGRAVDAVAAGTTIAVGHAIPVIDKAVQADVVDIAGRGSYTAGIFLA